MTRVGRSLRSRLFAAIAVIMALSVGLTIALGVVLTRRAVERAALDDVAHQADLLAGRERISLAPLAHLPELEPFLARQHERVLTPPLSDPSVLPEDARRNLLAGKSARGTVRLGDVRYYFAAEPVDRRAFVLLRPTSVAAADLHPFLEGLLIAGLVGATLAAVASLLLARRIARPVRRVAKASRSLAGGTAPAPVPLEGPEELVVLASSFNELAAQLARARAAEQSFLMSVSHELKTPLTAVRGYAEALRDRAVDVDEAAEVVELEAARLERLVGDLLDLARMRRSEFSVRCADVELADVVTDTVRRYEPQARAFGVDLIADVPSAAPALADGDRVVQVVSNLVENALRLTPPGGTVRVSARPGLVRVSDTGPGLRSEELPRAFERFYLHDRYGRARRVGTGLGLAIVKELTEAMGGSVSVHSEPGAGAEFIVRLRAAGAGRYASGLAPPNRLEPQTEQETFAAPPSGR